MRRLLFIAHRVPYPPDKGERVRAFHQLKALAEHCRITLAAPAHSARDYQSVQPLRQWCQAVLLAPAGGGRGLARGAVRSLLGGSVTEGYFASRRLNRLIDAEARREPFDLVFAYSSGTLPYALAVPAPVRVMDLIDVDSAKWADYAARACWPKSLLFRRESRAVRCLELEAIDRCDAVLVVSDAEARLLPDRPDKVTVVGNGVDTEFFSPQPVPPGPPGLVFTGSMGYWPNAQGVCWFVREVWPGLRREHPDLTFTIVGRDPTPQVRELAAQPGVVVTGTVEDVRPYLAAAAVAVCPLRIARGVQNKVLEAMSAGRAVVATPAALAGLDVQVGRDALSADTPDQWQHTISGLLRDDALRSRIGQAARDCVLSRYPWAVHMGRLVNLCDRLADSGQAGSAAALDATGRPGGRAVGTIEPVGD